MIDYAVHPTKLTNMPIHIIICTVYTHIYLYESEYAYICIVLGYFFLLSNKFVSHRTQQPRGNHVQCS